MGTMGKIFLSVLGGLTLGNQVTLAQDQGVQATGGLANTPANEPKLSVPAEDDLVLNNLVMSALADLDSPEPKTRATAAEKLQSADVKVIDLLEPLLKSGNLSPSQQTELYPVMSKLYLRDHTRATLVSLKLENQSPSDALQLLYAAAGLSEALPWEIDPMGNLEHNIRKVVHTSNFNRNENGATQSARRISENFIQEQYLRVLIYLSPKNKRINPRRVDIAEGALNPASLLIHGPFAIRNDGFDRNTNKSVLPEESITEKTLSWGMSIYHEPKIQRPMFWVDQLQFLNASGKKIEVDSKKIGTGGPSNFEYPRVSISLPENFYSSGEKVTVRGKVVIDYFAGHEEKKFSVASLPEEISVGQFVIKKMSITGVDSGIATELKISYTSSYPETKNEFFHPMLVIRMFDNHDNGWVARWFNSSTDEVGQIFFNPNPTPSNTPRAVPKTVVLSAPLVQGKVEIPFEFKDVIIP